MDLSLKHVVSAHDLKASLLALGAVFPGAIALVCSLVGAPGRGHISGPEKHKKPWQREYEHGLNYEVYCVDFLTAAHDGPSAATREAVWICPFNQIVVGVAKVAGALLVAVGERDAQVHINPPSTLSALAARCSRHGARGRMTVSKPFDKKGPLRYMFLIAKTKQKALFVMDELFRNGSELHSLVSGKDPNGATPLDRTQSRRTSVHTKLFRKSITAKGISSPPRSQSPRRMLRAQSSDSLHNFDTRKVLVCCPTPRTMRMCPLLIAKLWRLWPNLTVAVLHGGGPVCEAQMLWELRNTFRTEFPQATEAGRRASSPEAGCRASSVAGPSMTDVITKAAVETLREHKARVDRLGTLGADLEEQLTMELEKPRQYVLQRDSAVSVHHNHGNINSGGAGNWPNRNSDGGGDGDDTEPDSAESPIEDARRRPIWAPDGPGVSKLTLELHSGDPTNQEALRRFLECCYENNAKVDSIVVKTDAIGGISESKSDEVIDDANGNLISDRATVRCAP